MTMALVTIDDAAKLVRKARTTLTRDIENGLLTKTVLQDGDIRIDTAELLRAYGRLHPPQAPARPKPKATGRTSGDKDKNKIALLEERIRSLERVIALEGELRRVKDQVTTEMRARLADKDHLIKILESKILFLEYDQQTRAVPTLEPEKPAQSTPADPAGAGGSADSCAGCAAGAAPAAQPGRLVASPVRRRRRSGAAQIIRFNDGGASTRPVRLTPACAAGATAR